MVHEMLREYFEMSELSIAIGIDKQDGEKLLLFIVPGQEMKNIFRFTKKVRGDIPCRKTMLKPTRQDREEIEKYWEVMKAAKDEAFAAEMGGRK